MARIKYTCKNCGWSREVPSQWADIKPKRCMNAKCNTSFVKEPKSLVIDDPTRQAKSVKSEVKFQGKPNKLEKAVEEKKEEDEASSRKSKRSRKTKQQPDKEETKSSS